MESKFEVYFSRYFIEQWQGYGNNTQAFINNKLSLIAHNPFRFRKHKGYAGVFKVKLDVENRYSRLMYTIYYPNPKSVTILGIFSRDRDYKDFERIFGYLRHR